MGALIPADTEKRLLQMVVIAGSCVPLTVGLATIFRGPAFLGIDPAIDGGTDLASHLAYLSGIFVAVGLLFLICVRHIESNGSIFQVAAAMVFLGGLGRLVSLGLEGSPSLVHRLALVMELGVVPALVLWQARIARIVPSSREGQKP